MVTIRLARGGRKKRSFFRIVVTNSRKPRDTGRPIECLGFYNPITSGKETILQIAEDRVYYWISRGAQPSEQVRSLLKKKSKNEVNSPKKTDDQAVTA
ncbi:MAG: 30S ribosomal protein S16 [Gammaproteobacteria bacterium]|nr:MAG: 30S ribosomal protein S16 [Gammaproteobacteria bacterium]